jgi:hypothetical protein
VFDHLSRPPNSTARSSTSETVCARASAHNANNVHKSSPIGKALVIVYPHGIIKTVLRLKGGRARSFPGGQLTAGAAGVAGCKDLLQLLVTERIASRMMSTTTVGAVTLGM